MYLTDLNNLSVTNMFWQISNDGNLLPTPVQVPAVALGVAERADVIIDFAPVAGRTLYIENRLEQRNGQGPTGNVLTAGTGNLYLKIVVDGPTVADNSVNPATGPCSTRCRARRRSPGSGARSTSTGRATASGSSTTSSSTATPCASRFSRPRWSTGSSTGDSAGAIPSTSTSRSSRSLPERP